MSYSPLTMSRRHVLGELYGRCDRVLRDIPVYLNDTNGERLGHVDEGQGHFADAFTFHLSEDNCKKLAGGQFTYSFDYHFSESATAAGTPQRRRIRLVSIFLTMRKGYQKPIPRSVKASLVTPEAEN